MYMNWIHLKNYTFTLTMYLLILKNLCFFSFAWQHIPSEFGKRHLLGLGKKKGDIHLRLLNGRVWPARYIIRKGNRKGDKFEMHSSEWKTFAEDNNLKVGDVCTFELFPTSTILTFIVHIFRETDNDNTNCSTSQRDLFIWRRDLFFHPMQNLSKWKKKLLKDKVNGYGAHYCKSTIKSLPPPRSFRS